MKRKSEKTIIRGGAILLGAVLIIASLYLWGITPPAILKGFNYVFAAFVFMAGAFALLLGTVGKITINGR